MKSVIIFSLLIITLFAGYIHKNKHHSYYDYLMQFAPSDKPTLFLPQLLPVHKNIRDIAFLPDFSEFYFSELNTDTFTIMLSKYINGEWQPPETASFSGVYSDMEPFISHDGKKLYFASKRPSKGKDKMENDIDIWEVDRLKNGWADPQKLDDEINTNCMEYYPSVTKDGSLYFGRNDSALMRGDIHRSVRSQNKLTNPQKLPPVVNLPQSSFNAFISPDEDFIIFSAYVQDSLSFHSDLFISYQDENNSWSKPKNLGKNINSRFNEISPWVSPDKKLLFFSSTRLDTMNNTNYDIFWVEFVGLN